MKNSTNSKKKLNICYDISLPGEETEFDQHRWQTKLIQKFFSILFCKIQPLATNIPHLYNIYSKIQSLHFEDLLAYIGTKKN